MRMKFNGFIDPEIIEPEESLQYVCLCYSHNFKTKVKVHQLIGFIHKQNGRYRCVNDPNFYYNIYAYRVI